MAAFQASANPLEVAQLLRTGKSMSNGRATLIQEDKPRIEVMAAFGDLSQAEPAQLRIAAPPGS